MEKVGKFCALLILAILSILTRMDTLVCGAKSAHKTIPTDVQYLGHKQRTSGNAPNCPVYEFGPALGVDVLADSRWA